MLDIQFDEKQEFNRPTIPSRASIFTRVILKTGLVKTEQGVRFVLISIIIVSFFATLFIIFGRTTSESGQLGPTEPAAFKAAREASLRP